MNSWTRKALGLGPDADNAAAAAALDKGGHSVTMRVLEQKDPGFLMALRTSFFPTYNRLYKAQYGVDAKPSMGEGAGPKGPSVVPDAKAGQQAKIKLAAFGPTVTLKQLQREAPNLVLQLRHHAPDDYQRLYRAQYPIAAR